ncbi:MAG: RNase adapter RapZ [Pseudomonadales bacterium]|nr:RNase adapter RapZ [Pseudomonadales bacterium]
MSLIILSGRSGSGKSTALHVLEDMGYYCIDNLPVSLLGPLIARISQEEGTKTIAVSIDARNIASDLAGFPDIINSIDGSAVQTRVVYLDSASPALVKRFSETRRKHPLSDQSRDLREALDLETRLLDPISSMADLSIDTTTLTIHELRDLVRTRVIEARHEFALLFQSFAFKNGVPVDADLVFDVRCLPNPHWKPNLRALTGLDQPVQAFLLAQPDVIHMRDDIQGYLEKWLPRFEENNRSYMTVAIGCTGGQHRSVFISDQLFHHFEGRWRNVQIRHRELRKTENSLTGQH